MHACRSTLEDPTREKDLHLSDAKIYAYHYDDFDSETNRAIRIALEVLEKRQSGPEAAAAYQRLEKLLAPHLARSAKQIASFLAEQHGWIEVVKYRQGRLLQLEMQATTAANRDGMPHKIYHADDLDVNPIGRSNPALATIGTVANYFYLVFAIIGFAMLWRRGGESPIARWLGLLLIGFSSFLLMEPSNGLLRSMEYELWIESLHSGALSSLKIAALACLSAVTLLLGVAVMFAIPFSVVWVELCWPSARPEEERGFVDWLVSLVKMFVVTVGFYFASIVMGMGVMFVQAIILLATFGPDPPDPDAMPAMVAGAIGATVLLLLIGAWLRQSLHMHSEVPHFGWKPLAMMGSGVAAFIALTLWQRWDWSAAWQADVCVGIGLALVAVFVATALGAMLADNFLCLSEARDLSAILATAVLPFALESSAFSVDFVFRDFHLLLHSEHGSTVLSILLAVLVMVPLHAWLERNFKRWSLGPLASLAADIENLLEELPHLAETERRKRVDAFFETCQIPTYAFYARSEGDVFLPVVGHYQGEPAPLPLSKSLLDFLQERPHFCDLEHIPFEWPYYFQQFELYRLQQASGGRYLLPLALGSTVRGLLLLADCPGAETLARDAIAEELAPLGLEVVCGGVVLEIKSLTAIEVSADEA